VIYVGEPITLAEVAPAELPTPAKATQVVNVIVTSPSSTASTSPLPSLAIPSDYTLKDITVACVGCP
jgi:hypothetical protein